MLYAVTRAHLVREMTTWGMLAAEARSLVDSTLAALADCLPVAAARTPSVDPRLVDHCAGRVDALRISPPD
jgi:hypothetical protein